MAVEPCLIVTLDGEADVFEMTRESMLMKFFAPGAATIAVSAIELVAVPMAGVENEAGILVS